MTARCGKIYQTSYWPHTNINYHEKISRLNKIKMTVNDEVAWQNYLAHKVQHIVVMLYNMSKLTMMLIVFGHTQEPSGLSLQNSDPNHLHASASATLPYSFTHLIAPCGCEYTKGFL